MSTKFFSYTMEDTEDYEYGIVFKLSQRGDGFSIEIHSSVEDYDEPDEIFYDSKRLPSAFLSEIGAVPTPNDNIHTIESVPNTLEECRDLIQEIIFKADDSEIYTFVVIENLQDDINNYHQASVPETGSIMLDARFNRDKAENIEDPQCLLRMYTNVFDYSGIGTLYIDDQQTGSQQLRIMNTAILDALKTAKSPQEDLIEMIESGENDFCHFEECENTHEVRFQEMDYEDFKNVVKKICEGLVEADLEIAGLEEHLYVSKSGYYDETLEKTNCYLDYRDY